MTKPTPITFESDLSALDFLKLMRDNIDADGTLYLNDCYDIELDDLTTCNDFIIKINLDDDAMNILTENYNNLYAELENIADKLNQAYQAKKDNAADSYEQYEIEQEKLQETYNIHVEPLVNELAQKLEAQINNGAEGFCKFEMKAHAQRVCALLELNAPKIIIQNEARYLITYMAIFLYATSVEKVNK